MTQNIDSTYLPLIKSFLDQKIINHEKTYFWSNQVFEGDIFHVQAITSKYIFDPFVSNKLIKALYGAKIGLN